MRNYLLLTPGPLSTTQSVREAMLQDWCTWDEDYNVGIVTDIRTKLMKLAGVGEEYTTVLLQGSGTYAVEATFGTVMGKKGRVLIVSNGAYGDRMGKICQYLGIDHILASFPETELITGTHVKELLELHQNVTHLAVVHCETTTGILNSLEEIAEEVSRHDVCFIVDAMSSFGGISIDIEGLGIDFLISSSNKCIQGVPGFGFVIARKDRLALCEGNSFSYSLDLYDQWKEMEAGKGKWRFTSPTHVVRAFHQALMELEEEGGISARNERYQKNHDILVNGMRAAGFQTLLADELMSPIITSFLYPNKKFEFKKFYFLLKERGFVIYPGKISQAETFRIGNIGDVYPEDFQRLVEEVTDICQSGLVNAEQE